MALILAPRATSRVEDVTFELDAHTAVRPQGDGSYAADLDPGWVVGGGVNGGYLLALMGPALRAAFPRKPDPLAVSAYYLSAAAPGPATVAVDVRREGGSVGTASAELHQGDEVRLAALAADGALDRLGDDVRTTAEEPHLPPPDECMPNSMGPPEIREIAPLMHRFDMRFHPDHIGWAVGSPSGKGELSAWFRLVDDREPDPISLLMVV